MRDPASTTASISRRQLVLLTVAALLVLASRLPWIAAGPGTDPDSYRVINAARHIAETGRYAASRLPGFPVHEYLTAAVVRFGPAATNMVTALCSVSAFVFFALLLREAGARAWLLGALAFAFSPVVFVNSTCTIDYIPSLMFMLAAAHALLRRHPLAAGILLGLAVGCRITAGAMLLPFIVWTLREDRGVARIRRIGLMVAATTLVAAFCFLPVLATYGAGFFTYYGNTDYPSALQLLAASTVALWGVPGVVALLGLCILAPFIRTAIGVRFGEPRCERAFRMALLVVLLYEAVFLLLPVEAGYLIPATPFALLMAAVAIPERYFRAAAVVLCVSAAVTIGRHGITTRTPIVRDHEQRIDGMDYTRRVAGRVKRLPPSAIVVAGSELPAIESLLGSSDPNRYVFLFASDSICDRYAREGRSIYYLRGMDAYNMRDFGVNLHRHGAVELDSLDQGVNQTPASSVPPPFDGSR
jgi:hypothetical protein